MDFHIYIRSFIFHIQFIWKTTVERAETDETQDTKAWEPGNDAPRNGFL